MGSPSVDVDAVHERLVAELLLAGEPYGLMPAGGDAVRAHGLVAARRSGGLHLLAFEFE
ncbi:hypothetical protein [Streptomyces sp. NPDC048584]|uniref:hypothetical protein n=1 Tax=Streptomyces sp. NPDC048584 TaxID=3365573 RepID=UPI0037109CF2